MPHLHVDRVVVGGGVPLEQVTVLPTKSDPDALSSQRSDHMIGEGYLRGESNDSYILQYVIHIHHIVKAVFSKGSD